MIPSVRFERASADAVAWVAGHLRDADAEEMAAAHGKQVDHLAVLRASVAASDGALAAWAGDEPLAILGCARCGTMVAGFGAPWLLGTPASAKHPRVFVAAGRRFAAQWLAQYGRLVNYVDARNASSVRWLRAIGFSLEPLAPFGAMGLPFHRFSM